MLVAESPLAPRNPAAPPSRGSVTGAAKTTAVMPPPDWSAGGGRGYYGGPVLSPRVRLIRADRFAAGYGPRAAGLALGFAADLVLGDPARAHPVAAFGRFAGGLERRWWRDQRSAGVAFAAIGVAAPALLGATLTRGRGPRWTVLSTAATTWTVLGGTSLVREGERMGRLLTAGDLDGARGRLGYLCAREADGLDAVELVRATVESLAENTSDAVVAPLVWGLIAGVPGLLAYRAVNTLDAMVGYRSARYERFGWAAARLDDLANLLPARVCAALTVALAPAVGGSLTTAGRVLRRDGAHHPSPNAGRVEAAFAGALGVRLGGVNQYGAVREQRSNLGSGPTPAVPDIARAARLSRLVQVAALALVLVLAATLGRLGARPRLRRR